MSFESTANDLVGKDSIIMRRGIWLLLILIFDFPRKIIAVYHFDPKLRHRLRNLMNALTMQWNIKKFKNKALTSSHLD